METSLREKRDIMVTSSFFADEIKLIKHPTMRDIVSNTLDAAPECITVIPASSSGRYHPKADLIAGNVDEDGRVITTGGLVAHTKTVVAICRSLMDSNCFRDIVFGIGEFVNDKTLRMYQDAAIAACILHDCCKPDDTPEHKTVFNHPVLAADLFLDCAEKYIVENRYSDSYIRTIIPIIYNAIASHMGKWNVSWSDENKVLPLPQTGIDVVVHLCDYLASRKFLDMNFDAYAKNKW